MWLVRQSVQVGQIFLQAKSDALRSPSSVRKVNFLEPSW